MINDKRITLKSFVYLSTFTALIFTLFSFSIYDSSANADTMNPVVTWNTLTGNLGLLNNHGPPQLARDYALVHIAIYDALLDSNKIKGDRSQDAIVIGAASEVLQYLFPENTAEIKAFTSSEIKKIIDKNGAVKSGLNLGQKVGKNVVKYAKHDNYDTPWDGTMPTGDCNWTGVNPIGVTFGYAKPFVLTSANEFPIPSPPECGSAEYQSEVNIVLDTFNNLTPEQIQIAKKWEPIPAILHNQQLDERILSHNLSIFDAARAAAYVNVASYDSMVAVWHSKYTYWTERPFQHIDGFTPVIVTPNFPAYPSGHSTAAPATAVILGNIFPEDAASLLDDAAENAVSRLYGGVHWNIDDSVGYSLGLQIGNKVLDDMNGPQHPFIYPKK